MQLCTIATEYFALLETEVTAIHSERAVAVPIFPTAALSEGARLRGARSRTTHIAFLCRDNSGADL